MKQTLINTKWLLALIGCLLFLQSQTTFSQSRGTWEKDTLMKQFPCITDVENRWNSGGDVVRFHFDVDCKSTPTVTPENFFEVYKDLLLMGEDDSLVLKKALDSSPHRLRGGGDYDGRYEYRQYYKGYPVEGGGVKLNLYHGKVRMVVDYLRKVDREINPKISVEEAICLVDSALLVKSPNHQTVYVPRNKDGKYGWDSSYLYYYLDKAYLKEHKRNKHYYLIYDFKAIGNHPRVDYGIIFNPAKGTIAIGEMIQLNQSPCLTACNSSVDEPMDDCANGSSPSYAYFEYLSSTFNQDVVTFPTYGNDIDMGTSCQSMIMDYCFSPPDNLPRVYRLSRTDLPVISVYDTPPPTSPIGAPVIFPNELDISPFPTPYQFKDGVLCGVSAYWGVDLVEDYFQNFPNYLNSFDGNNATINIGVNNPLVTNNAQWRYFGATINHLVISDYEYASRQIMAHEYTHGVLYNNYNITDLGNPMSPEQSLETIALHEGLADIFAIMAERYAANNGIINDWSWHFKAGNQNRYLNNPEASNIIISGTTYHQADTYKGTYWSTHLDNLTSSGWQYMASGVPCYWFYLLAQPVGEVSSGTNDKGDSYDVTGIGVFKAEQILVEGLKRLSLLEGNEDVKFGDLREHTIAAAGALFSDCSTEVIETQNAWYAVGVGTNDPELWMKDGEDDIGLEPNTYQLVYDGEGNIIDEDIYESPDLWNRTETGISDFNSVLKDHDQPEQDDMSTLNNTLMVEVHNSSTTCNSPAADVHLYWTLASTGEKWHNTDNTKNDWIAHYDDASGCLIGDQIGTITIPSDDIPLGDTRKYGLEWMPPSPEILRDNISDGGCGLMPDNVEEGEFEICFLARLIADGDPLENEDEGKGSTRNNVVDFNNIVTRNTFVVPVTGDGLATVDYPVRYLFIKNTDDFYNHLDISFEGIVTANNCPTDVDIDLVLSDDLWTKWQSTGLQGDGVVVIAPQIVRITDCSQAKLKDIPFQGSERQAMGVKATLVSGKNGNFSRELFRFKITHESTNPDVAITPPTTCLFDLEYGKASEQTEAIVATANSFEFRPSPNPFTHHMRLSYELEEEAEVRITLYDLQGKPVQEIMPNTSQQSGRQSLYFDGSDLKSGVYLCAIRMGDKVFTQKVVKVD